MARRRKHRGPSDAFTLVEILVVLALLGVLMGIGAGMISRIGRGNVLIQTTYSLASQLATARANAFGPSTARVEVHADDGGEIELRTYRNRPVFTWLCEDLETASQDVLTPVGGVEVSADSAGNREGRYAMFGKGGQVKLGSPPWLAFRDGFSIVCRVRPAEDAGTLKLFSRGTAFRIALVPAGEGRYDVEARIRLDKDPADEKDVGGDCELRTGFRGEKEVPEWRGPILGGRWSEVKISYDRNALMIHVDDRLRGIRSDKHGPIQLRSEPFVIGDGYAGDFDSLNIGGIFEDDDDRYDVPSAVQWIDAQGQVQRSAKETIHFRGRRLDPRFHPRAVRLLFQLDTGEERSPRRLVIVRRSGESAVMRPDEDTSPILDDEDTENGG